MIYIYQYVRKCEQRMKYIERQKIYFKSVYKYIITQACLVLYNIDQNILFKIILSYNFVGVQITCKLKKKNISQKIY